MTTWTTVVPAVLAVLAVVGVGVVLRRVNWLTEEADQTLMAVIVRVLMPCLIVQNTLQNAALRIAGNVFWPPAVGAAGLLVGFLVAAIWARAARGGGLETAAQRGTFTLTAGLQNYIYLPLPLIALLFPQQAEATTGVLFVHNVGTEFVMWTVGVLVLSGGLGKRWWKRVINPPSVTVVLMLILNQWHIGDLVPAFILHALGMLGGCAIPLSLLLVGAMVSDQIKGTRWRDGMGEKGGWTVMAGACLVRLGILPALLLLAAKFLPITTELRHVLVLQAAMPAAMFPVVMAKYYRGDPPTAVRVVGATSILGLVTIPVWISVGLWWIR